MAPTRDDVTDLATRFVVATDRSDWAAVRRCFADRVVVDYSELTGVPRAEVEIEGQVEVWRERIERYDRVRHRLSNIHVDGQTVGGATACGAYVDVDARITHPPYTVWSAAGRYAFEVVDSPSGYVFSSISVVLDWTETTRHTVREE